MDRTARPFTKPELAKHMESYAGILDANMGMSGKKWTHVEYTGLSVKRNFIKERYDEFFTKYDVLLCPVTPVPAYPHSDVPIGARTYTGSGIPEFGVAAMSLWPGIIIVADLPSTV